jgi:hypothetical protein
LTSNHHKSGVKTDSTYIIISAEPPPEELAQAGRNGHGSLAAGSLLLG